MIRVTENLRKIRDLLDKAAVDAGRRSLRTSTCSQSAKNSHSTRSSRLLPPDNGILAKTPSRKAPRRSQNWQKNRLNWHFHRPPAIQQDANRRRALRLGAYDRQTERRRAPVQEQRPDSLGVLNVCLQVNIDKKPARSPAEHPESTLAGAGPWRSRTLPRLTRCGV